jgi:hypothetical protein
LGLGWGLGGAKGYGVRGRGYGLAVGVRRTCSDASRGAPEMPEQCVEQATVVNHASTMRVQTQTQHQGCNPSHWLLSPSIRVDRTAVHLPLIDARLVPIFVINNIPGCFLLRERLAGLGAGTFSSSLLQHLQHSMAGQVAAGAPITLIRAADPPRARQRAIRRALPDSYDASPSSFLCICALRSVPGGPGRLVCAAGNCQWTRVPGAHVGEHTRVEDRPTAPDAWGSSRAPPPPWWWSTFLLYKSRRPRLRRDHLCLPNTGLRMRSNSNLSVHILLDMSPLLGEGPE